MHCSLVANQKAQLSISKSVLNFVQVYVLLDQCNDELRDGVSVVEGHEHRVGEVSPTQDTAPGTIVGKLSPGLDLVSSNIRIQIYC